MTESIDRRPSQPRFVKRIRNRHGRTYYYFRRPPFPHIRLPGEPASPLFITAYYAALQASTREEFIALRAGMKAHNQALGAPFTKAVMAWAEGRPITRAQAMLIAARLGVSVEYITRNREILD